MHPLPSTRTIQRSQGPRASGETLRPAPRQQTFPTKESYAQEIKERKESDLVEATVGMLYCCTGNKDTTNMEIKGLFGDPPAPQNTRSWGVPFRPLWIF